MRMALEQSVDACVEGAKCQYGVLEVRQMPEEYLIASPTRYTKMPDEETFLRTFRNHLKYCEQKELSTRLQAGEIIPLERARRRCFVESHYFNPVQGRVEDERLYIKPAGESMRCTITRESWRTWWWPSTTLWTRWSVRGIGCVAMCTKTTWWKS